MTSKPARRACSENGMATLYQLESPRSCGCRRGALLRDRAGLSPCAARIQGSTLLRPRGEGPLTEWSGTDLVHNFDSPEGGADDPARQGPYCSGNQGRQHTVRGRPSRTATQAGYDSSLDPGADEVAYLTVDEAVAELLGEEQQIVHHRLAIRPGKRHIERDVAPLIGGDLVGLELGDGLGEEARVEDLALPPNRRGEMEDCPVTAHPCLCFSWGDPYDRLCPRYRRWEGLAFDALSTGGCNLGPMVRAATPAAATKELVAALRAQGVDCSSRRLEDWRRVGLIPRGHQRSLGRGRGTEVVYPDDMAERCRRVAERMRRGQPWQVVALSLFADGADLPEETVRAAYRWALTIEAGEGGDELDAAERALDHLSSTAAGRRVQAQVAAHVKQSGVAPDESPSAVARSVLTNLLLVALGGEVADDTAMSELLAGVGLPIAELPPDEQVRLARFVDAVLAALSTDELVGVAEGASLEELRSAFPVAAQLREVLPDDLRALIPPRVAELLPALLAPLIVQLQRVAAELFLAGREADQRPTAPLSHGSATMGPVSLARPPGAPEPAARDT